MVLEVVQCGDVRVVQVERGRFAADLRQGEEVVPRGRAGGRPLQRTAVAPRVVDADRLAVLGRLPDVVEEGQHRQAEQERGDRRDRVQRGEAVGRQVVR